MTWRTPDPPAHINWATRKRIITRVFADLAIQAAGGEILLDDVRELGNTKVETIFELMSRRVRTAPHLAGKRATGRAFQMAQKAEKRGKGKSAAKPWETPASRRQRHADTKRAREQEIDRLVADLDTIPLDR